MDAELFTLNDLFPDNECADSLIGFEPLSIINSDGNITKDIGGIVLRSIAETINSRGKINTYKMLLSSFLLVLLDR